jgi:CubicO group peptidase (beta-lactamase class C family)
MVLRNRFYIVAIVLAVLGSCYIDAYSQTSQNERREMSLPTLRFPAGKNVVEVPFEVESCWMLIPVSVNGSRPLRYVLDSGAAGAVHQNPAIVDSLNLRITGTMQAGGAGGGGATSEVPVAENVNFNIGGIDLPNGNLAIRPSRSGHDGVIGRPIFENLVVEIDWEKQVIRFYEPAKYKYSGSGRVLRLTFDEGGRPYTMASLAAAGEKTIPVKLVVDTGGGHTLSLEVGSNSEIRLPEGASKAVLGRGASGEITGYTGRIKALELGGQMFKDVPTIFPDSSSGTNGINGRQGNLGSGILRRFKVIYDYSRKQMIVEPNKFCNDPFGTVMQSTAASLVSVAPAALQDYVGRYGNKEISVRDAGLYYQRIGGREAALRPTGKDKFALNTDAQITFVRDANNVVTEMIIEWVERDKEQLKRESPAVTQSLNQPQAASPKRSAADDSAFAKELNTYLEQATASDAFSGAVLVARNGQPIFVQAYGMANKSNGTLNNIDTKFDLGSMNKMFTAVAIAQLAERGKLSFTDTVGKLLPDYPNKAVAEKVTVHHLLTHTSGMASYFNEKFRANLNNMKTVADYLPLFANDPLAFEPGTKWQYSNSGFTVLGLIIEKVSGQSYYDYVKEHIFKPAGMVNTDSYERDLDVPNLAIGYTKMGDNGRPDPSAARRANTATRPTKGSPAGGGYSTVEDLLRFSVALREHKLLSQKYTETVTTGKVDTGGAGRKYAYGFGEEESNGRHIVGHNGGGPGIGANFDMFPELGYTAVTLTNYDPPDMMPVIMKIRELIPITPSLTAGQSQQQKPGNQSEQEVRRLEREWLDAYEQHNAAAMDRIVADNFVITQVNGTMQSKAEILADLKASRESSLPSSTFSTEDVQARVYGDTVILIGRVIQRSSDRDGQKRIIQFRYTDTYVKQQGRWQVVASQLTRIPQQ